MVIIDTTFVLPPEITLGLATGKYKRYGGIIRNPKGQIIYHLREIPTNHVDALSTVANVSSILNLALSTMEFAVLLHRLNLIEKRIVTLQKTVHQIDMKFDLSFYANFRAAIDLAHNAFSMSKTENRKVSAMQAINRFLEAEQHYTQLADNEIEQTGLMMDKYLYTLSLAYISEARCYLELEEVNVAQQRLQLGREVLRPRFEKYVKTLLTSNPAAYLHPSLQGTIDLRRMTEAFLWFDPSTDENSVFEELRPKIWELAANDKQWMESLPKVFEVNKNTPLEKLKRVLPNRVAANKGTDSTEGEPTTIFSQLPKFFNSIEEAIESEQRFEGYILELDEIIRRNITFSEWKRITSASDDEPDGANYFYVKMLPNEAV